MKWTADVARGDWIAPRLEGWGRVGSTVPRGYEAYARVFHPVELDRVISRNPRIETEERLTTWREIAERFGTTWHPAMQWNSIALPPSSQFDIGDGWRLNDPQVGQLDLSALATLARALEPATSTPDDIVVGVWHGWGDLRPSGEVITATRDGGDGEDARDAAVRELAESVSPEVARAAEAGPTLALPSREYVLLEARIDEFVDPAWVDGAGIGWHWGFGPTPNVLWPEDRTWFLATEIDFDSTIIGGSRALIDSILATSALEAAEVDADTSLASDADTVNGPPD